ncbi:hypothetical protein Tco_0399819 [Tanacetum coccineum]
MTAPITTNGIDNQMHNNIMAVGSRDRPPMLAPGRYAQWQSPQPATNESPAVEARTLLKDFLNISFENKARYDAEKEAIHLLLTRIGDEIYSTVDACKTAHDMWIAIERLQHGESLNIQDVKTKWSRFVTIVKQTQELDTISYYKLFDILKQYQKEVNEIRAEKITRNANPLALVAAAQQYPDPYYQAPKPHKSYAPQAKTSLSIRSHATTRHKGKDIAKPITARSESVHGMYRGIKRKKTRRFEA